MNRHSISTLHQLRRKLRRMEEELANEMKYLREYIEYIMEQEGIEYD